MLFRTILVSLTLPSLAFAALGPRSKPGVELVTELLKLPSEVRFEAIAKQPDRVYDTLLDVARANEQSMNIRWKAVTSAALLRREKAVPDLIKLSESKDWYIRNASLVGMAEVAPRQSVKLAHRLLKDPALVVRSAAVDVLSKNVKDADRDALWTEMASDYNRRGGQSLWIRGQILEVLAANAQKSELRRFSDLLSENDESVQKASMKGLEKITGLQVARNAASHSRAVQLWKAQVSRQLASEPR